MRSSYGDYLYDEDENDKAIEEYKQTIGFIEPSYVIKKFLDAQRMPQLATYLEALHMRSLANSEHTTLLINCYTKLKEKEKLHQFIYSDHAGIHFDVEMAVEVLRNAGCYEEALHLSKKHQLFMNHLRILIEDMQCFHDALAYIKYATLSRSPVDPCPANWPPQPSSSTARSFSLISASTPPTSSFSSVSPPIRASFRSPTRTELPEKSFISRGRTTRNRC